MTPEMAARQQHKQSWQQVETMNPFNPRDLTDDGDSSGAVLHHEGQPNAAAGGTLEQQNRFERMIAEAALETN